MTNADLSKFGSPELLGKKLPVTPTGLRGNFRNVTLDPRQFNIPADWAVISLSKKNEYQNDKNGNAQKTGRTYARFGLLNGAVARPLVKSGLKLDNVSIIPVRCDCYNSIDLNSFGIGDFVKLVKPVFLPQWQSNGAGGSYQGVRIQVQNVKKEGSNK